MSTKPLVRLDAWQVHQIGKYKVLWGLATGHPKHGGRHVPVRTSLIIRLDEQAGIAESLNTVYRLGPRLRVLAEDEQGNAAFVALGSVAALREPGTSHWDVARDQQAIGTVEADDVVEVIKRLLDELPGSDGTLNAGTTRH